MATVRIMPPGGRKRAVGVRSPDDEGKEHLAAPHEGVSADELTADTERVLAELGESASAVVLYRMKDNKPGEWDFVTRVPAAEFTPDYIKEQYGGGDYKVVIIDATQGALNPVFFSIDRRFVGKVWGAMAPAAVAAGATGDPFRDEMLKILLAKALTPPPMPQQNSSKETIELVLAVVAAMKSGGDSSNVFEMVNGMLQTSMTLAQSMNPPEGIGAVASQFLPLMERLVPAPRTARATLTAPPPKPAPVANPNPPAMTTEVQPPARVAGSIVPKWLAPFRTLAPMLVRFADRGSEPEVYAEMALEEMQDNETLFASAVEAMNEGHLLTDLFAVAPDLALTEPRKEFATKLVARITEGLQELINTPDDEPGDAANG